MEEGVASGEPSTDEATLPEDEWPVPREYRQPPPAFDEVSAAPEPVEPAAAEGRPPERERAPLRPVGALLGAALVALLLAAALELTLLDGGSGGKARASSDGPPPTGSATPEPGSTAPVETAVPDVSGLRLDEARKLLAESDLRARVRRVDSDRPEGEVVQQSPVAGSEVGKNEVVALMVSEGAAEIAVPAVVGLPVQEATDRLREAGLRRAVSTTTSSRTAGTVLRQTPESGTRVKAEAVVRLQVAARRARVDVPRLVGLPVAEAQARLEELGLHSTVTRGESSRREGTVVRQSPAGGSRLRAGRTVELEVSSGPRERVPDVTGLDEASARGELQAAGFEVRVVDQPTSDPSKDGIVVGQDPAGGSSVREGAVATLTVARLS